MLYLYTNESNNIALCLTIKLQLSKYKIIQIFSQHSKKIHNQCIILDIFNIFFLNHKVCILIYIHMPPNDNGAIFWNHPFCKKCFITIIQVTDILHYKEQNYKKEQNMFPFENKKNISLCRFFLNKVSPFK